MQPKSLYKRILVAVDGSEVSLRATDRAAQIAKDQGASLTALYVVVSPQFTISGEVADYYEQARKSAKNWMRDVESIAMSHDMTLKTEILVGAYSAVDAIIGYAENQSIDLIVTGTRGTSHSARLLVGSVATGLVQYAGCSVLVIR